jgi:hypothetical protein
MRRHVKNVNLNAIALERGGWANLTPSDFGRVGQIVREQYGYLRGFANDIASGKQRLDGTLGTRAKLYSQAGQDKSIQEQGGQHERRRYPSTEYPLGARFVPSMPGFRAGAAHTAILA